LRRTCLVMIFVLLLQPPSRSQDEASLSGLRGHVHTISTENFRNHSETPRETLDSSFEVFDRRGYQLENYLYKPDGSLWVHTVNSRDGEKIFRSETTGTAPFESFSRQSIFDAKGEWIETDTYDGDGKLTKKETAEQMAGKENGQETTSAGGEISEVETLTITRDAQGHIVEATNDSDPNHIRCTYSHDAKGRLSGQINYDAAGTVVEKTTIEYRDDATGNWIEMTTIEWDTTTDPMTPKVVETSLRVINYF